jgi:hypothetical protein
MIDRSARDTLISMIQRYLSGEISNEEYEHLLFRGRTKDAACIELGDAMLHFSSDFKRHFNAGDFEIPDVYLSRIKRWLAFLRSNTEWPIAIGMSERQRFPMNWLEWFKALFRRNVPDFVSNEFWPFKSECDWEHFAF